MNPHPLVHGFPIKSISMCFQFQFSCVWLFVTPWTATHQVPLYSTTSWSLLKYMFIESVMISNYLILCCPHLLLIPVLPRITVFSNGFSYQMAKILEYQHQSFQWIFRVTFFLVWMVGSPCSPRDSQETSPTPQFKSINSLALSFLYGPTQLQALRSQRVRHKISDWTTTTQSRGRTGITTWVIWDSP